MKGDRNMTKKVSILRTEGNAYDKIDRDRFMVYPRFRDIQSTSFLAVRDLTLMPADEYNRMKDIDEIDTESILNKIKHENF